MAITRFRQRILSIALSALATLGFSAHQQTPPSASAQTPPAATQAEVISPAPGQVLLGTVPIEIRTDVPGFVYCEVAFTYADDPTGTWFQLYESNQPVVSSTVIEWDTATMTDGDYNLRLSVVLDDGGQQVIFVPGLRVRNYTPVETATTVPTAAAPLSPAATNAPPAPTTQPSSAGMPTSTRPAPSATATPPATSTPGVRRNPAEIQPGQVSYSAAMGALAAAGIFMLAGIYWSLKRLGRR